MATINFRKLSIKNQKQNLFNCPFWCLWLDIVTNRVASDCNKLKNSSMKFKFFHILIHSGYFYSASSNPLLLRGTPDTAQILYQSFTPKRNRQLQVPMWCLERDSNPRPFGRKASNLPKSNHAPHC